MVILIPDGSLTGLPKDGQYNLFTEYPIKWILFAYCGRWNAMKPWTYIKIKTKFLSNSRFSKWCLHNRKKYSFILFPKEVKMCAKALHLKNFVRVDDDWYNRTAKSEVGGDEWHDLLKGGEPMVGDREFSALRWCFAALCRRDGAI